MQITPFNFKLKLHFSLNKKQSQKNNFRTKDFNIFHIFSGFNK